MDILTVVIIFGSAALVYILVNVVIATVAEWIRRGK